MQIQLNGEAYDLERPVTLAELLEQLELAGKRLAIEHNLNIGPRTRWAIRFGQNRFVTI